MHRATLLVVTTLLLAAGCTAPDAASPTPPVVRPPTLLVDTQLGCARFCEPSIAALPDGRLLVLADALGFQASPGAPFQVRPTPPMPLEAPPSAFQNDAIVQAGHGRFYYCALITAFDPVTLSLVMDGIQVAWTDDDAQTWHTTYLSVATTPTHSALGADRQWLTFGEAQDVYVSYQQITAVLSFGPLRGPLFAAKPPGSVRVAASRDGGQSFGDFQEAAAPGDSYILGAGTTLGQRLFVPYNSAHGVKVAISDDHGATFRQVLAAAGTPDFFPRLEALANGSLALAWKDGSDLRTAWSRDGSSWSAPATWDTNVTSSPWLVPSQDSWAVAWLHADGHGAYGLMLGRDAMSVRLANLTAPDSPRAYTDYVMAAALPGGRVAVVGADTQAGAAYVAYA